MCMRISWWEIGFENVSELEESGKTKCRLLHNSCDSSILGFIYWMPLSYFVRRNRVFEPIQIYTRRDIKQYKRNTAKERVYQINCIVTYFWKKKSFWHILQTKPKKNRNRSLIIAIVTKFTLWICLEMYQFALEKIQISYNSVNYAKNSMCENCLYIVLKNHFTAFIEIIISEASLR